MQGSSVQPSQGFQYYQGQVYWNNFAAVVALQNRLVSGKPDQGWMGYVRERYGRTRRGLFVQCGNGWVERECKRLDLIDEAVGTDIGAELLDEARRGAASIGLPAEYIVADTNRFDFTRLDYEWVFNNAAFHHIAHLDAALRSIWRGMKGQGLLVCFDYTGPHRNQYPWEPWSAMVALNDSLPKRFRADLQYPHLPTMLSTDPSEAVHSELILDYCRRYFDIVELRPLGGAIAYELLFGNRQLLAEENTEDGAAVIAQILAADLAYTRGDAGRSYFNFWVAVPRAEATLDPIDLDRWTREEEAREQEAARQGGRYGPKTALELIYDRLYHWKDKAQAAKPS